MNAVNRFNKPDAFGFVDGGRREENDCDWNRYAVTPLGKATVVCVCQTSVSRWPSFSVAASLSRFGRFLTVWPLLSLISVDNCEQRTDSTAHVRTQTDSLDGPAAVRVHSPGFTARDSYYVNGPSRPVIYRFNDYFIVCSSFVWPINH